jgi:hypothetical protein
MGEDPTVPPPIRTLLPSTDGDRRMPIALRMCVHSELIALCGHTWDCHHPNMYLPYWKSCCSRVVAGAQKELIHAINTLQSNRNPARRIAD